MGRLAEEVNLAVAGRASKLLLDQGAPNCVPSKLSLAVLMSMSGPIS